jgi:hypothetical protein
MLELKAKRLGNFLFWSTVELTLEDSPFLGKQIKTSINAFEKSEYLHNKMK